MWMNERNYLAQQISNVPSSKVTYLVVVEFFYIHLLLFGEKIPGSRGVPRIYSGLFPHHERDWSWLRQHSLLTQASKRNKFYRYWKAWGLHYSTVLLMMSHQVLSTGTVLHFPDFLSTIIELNVNITQWIYLLSMFLNLFEFKLRSKILTDLIVHDLFNGKHMIAIYILLLWHDYSCDDAVEDSIT